MGRNNWRKSFTAASYESVVKKIILICFFSAVILPLYATDAEKTDIKRSSVSADFSVLANALLHKGWGLGITGEYLFTDHFSVKGGFSHGTFFSDDTVCTTENLDLSFCYYPFAKGIDESLYLSCGQSTKFIQLSGDIFSDAEKSSTAYFLLSQIGWKQPIGKFIYLDIYSAYRFQLYNVSLPQNYQHVLTGGHILGIKIHLKFSNILNALRN